MRAHTHQWLHFVNICIQKCFLLLPVILSSNYCSTYYRSPFTHFCWNLGSNIKEVLDLSWDPDQLFSNSYFKKFYLFWFTWSYPNSSISSLSWFSVRSVCCSQPCPSFWDIFSNWHNFGCHFFSCVLFHLFYIDLSFLILKAIAIYY